MKKLILPILISTVLLAGCFKTEADVASENLRTAADSFEINRRIVFYNGITGEYILTIEGLCSVGNNDRDDRVRITCKTGQGTYKKHMLGLSNNVTFFAEQLESSKVSPYHYKVIFRPSTIIPDIEVAK